MGAAEERAAAAKRRRSRALIFASAVVLVAIGTFWLAFRALYQSPESLEPYRLRKLLNAAKVYRKDTGRFPATVDGLQALAPKYIDSLPSDGWGRAYLYESDGGSVRIWTLGRDGRPGGIGPDGDLSAQFPPAASGDAGSRQ